MLYLFTYKSFNIETRKKTKMKEKGENEQNNIIYL